MVPQPPLNWDDQVAGRNWVIWNSKELPHKQSLQHHLWVRAVIAQKCGIKIVHHVDYGVHRHSTNRADQRDVHINGFQRLLKPAKAGKQTKECAKHQDGLSACFTEILGNSKYSTTTETSHEISPSMPHGNEVTVEGRVSRKNKASETFLKANILSSIAGVREKQQRSCAQQWSGWRGFYPQTGPKMKCSLHNWKHINQYQCFSIQQIMLAL